MFDVAAQYARATVYNTKLHKFAKVKAKAFLWF